MEPRLSRIEQAAGELNAWLCAIAIGLGVLDMTVFAAKFLPLPGPPTVVSVGGAAQAGLQPPPAKIGSAVTHG
jgi:hypothetical protein